MEAETLLQRKQMGEFLGWIIGSLAETEEYMKYLKAIWQFVCFLLVLGC